MAAIDDFGGEPPNVLGLWRHGLAITPNDGTDLGHVSKGLYAATAGDVAFITAGGETLTVAVVAGSFLPWFIARVKATGTTATVFGGY